MHPELIPVLGSGGQKRDRGATLSIEIELT